MIVNNNFNTFNKTFYTNNNRRTQSTNINRNVSYSTPLSPSFKGRFDFVKTFFSKLFPQKKIAKAQKQIKKQTKNFIAGTLRELPFDGKERLKRIGFKEETVDKIVKTANGSKDHFQKLIKMKKNGFEEEFISEIFEVSKTGTGRLSLKLYNEAYALKELGIAQKHIAEIIKNFKIGAKFDSESFFLFKSLRKKASLQNIEPQKAFEGFSEEQIDDFFYSNIDNIIQTKKLLGSRNFVRLYSLDNKYITDIVEKTPKLVHSVGEGTKLGKLLKSKMNPINTGKESNFEIAETKEYSKQAMNEFQDRINILFEIFNLGEFKKGNKNSLQAKEMTRLLSQLSS